MGDMYCPFCGCEIPASPAYVDLRAEVERMKGAANRFAEGRISAGKLAEELGVEDKHAFKTKAGAFDDDCRAEVERLRGLYHDLLFQVEQKFPGEDRHATAKRQLQEANSSGSDDPCAKLEVKP